mmetsp:Transcript_47178/g.106346  ORF Transcript_47178/g.106346 Transcript_47178/m.106346 type:complete len:204 (-) Transcript_47178:57-668(-)
MAVDRPFSTAISCTEVSQALHHSHGKVSLGKEGRLGPRIVGDGEHAVHVHKVERSVQIEDVFEALAVDGGERGAVFTLDAESSSGDEVGAGGVPADSNDGVHDPVEGEEKCVAGVAAHAHADAKEGHAEARKSKEAHGKAGALARFIGWRRTPDAIVQKHEAEVLHRHHGRVRGDLGLIILKGLDGHAAHFRWWWSLVLPPDG